jgi:NADPH-dependent curcumin reductase CurA
MNHQWKLARKPAEGWPTDGDFEWVQSDIPQPGPGQLVSKTIYLSLDPYQWGRRRNGLEQPGEVCHGRAVAQVVASNIAGYREGDFMFNTNGWQEYGLSGDGVSVFGYMYPRKLDPTRAPISTAVGVMGMLGLTAYAGVYVQCQPKAGETVVVSAASGGVGQIAGQIAKLQGCRVVGIAGVEHKCDFVTNELGFDACVSHLSDSLSDDLAEACPDGIDIYFENVGGKVFAAVLELLNPGSRVTRCGLISQYGNTDGQNASRAWLEQGMETFERCSTGIFPLAVRNFVERHQDAFFEQMSDWIRDGKVKYREDVWTGLERAPEAFTAMLKGGNFGKTLVAVSEDPTTDSALADKRKAGDTLA